MAGSEVLDNSVGCGQPLGWGSTESSVFSERQAMVEKCDSAHEQRDLEFPHGF